MKLRLAILIAIVTWQVSLNGQDLRFTPYTVSDGLANNAIRAIYQDSNGFLWISTWEGLSKYDGHKFTNYTPDNGMPHSLVNDVIEISPGILMVALNDGSVCLINKGKLKTIGDKKFILNKFYFTRRKDLIATTDRTGIVSINGTKISKPNSGDSASIFGFIETKSGKLLGIADHHTVISYGSSWEPLKKMPPAPLTPTSILEDRNNNIWIGTETGLKYLPPNSNIDSNTKWPLLPRAFNTTMLPVVSISSIYEDEEKNLWFGTAEGLVKVTPSGAQSVFTEKDGLPSRRITAIYSDREKNLWIGTYAGLAKLAYSTIQTVKIPDEGVQNHAYSIQPATPEHLIVITNNALFDFNKSTYQFRKVFDVDQGNLPAPVGQRNGFSICSKGGIYDYDPYHFKFSLASPLKIPGYFGSFREGNIFAYGGVDGLKIIFKGKELQTVLRGSRINNVMIDRKGRIWVGTWETGLYRITISPDQPTISKIENLTEYAYDIHIRFLFEDSKGNTWVGTRYNGLTLFPSNDSLNNLPHINHRAGLISNWVYCIAETETGDIWVSTLGGVNKILHDKGGYRTFNFSRINNYYATVNTMVPGHGNELWCNSDKGMFRIIDNYMEKMPPMNVRITLAQLGKSNVNFAEEELNGPVTLKHNQNLSHFEFTAPGLINEKEILYSYRLIGSADTNWTIPSNTHSVQYASLNPGNYQFEVRMIGWNEELGAVTAFPFIIRSPYWQTTWFILAAGLLVIFIFYSIYRYRIRQLMKLQHVRNNIATDLHDDIGSSLTNISILSQLSISHLDKPKEAQRFLARITEQVQGSSEALDDIIWSVNSHHDSLTETLARMRRYAGDLFDHSTIKCELEFDEPVDDIRLDMEQRRDLFLVYKELLNNVVKHSAASLIKIQVHYSQKQIHLTVTDDGKGFDHTLPTDRNGLKNLQLRAARWKGKVIVQTIPGKGSTISITIPVLNNNLV